MSFDLVHALLTGAIIFLFILLLNTEGFLRNVGQFQRLLVAGALLFVVLVVFDVVWFQLL